MSQFVTVLATAGSRQEADAIAAALVKSRLAACVQTLAIESRFFWEGEPRSEPEWLMLVKTRQDLFEAVEALITSLHSYEVPEIVALPIVAGSQGYLDWVAASTGDGRADPA